MSTLKLAYKKGEMICLREEKSIINDIAELKDALIPWISIISATKGGIGDDQAYEL